MSKDSSEQSPAQRATRTAASPNVFQPGRVRRVGIAGGVVNDLYHQILIAAWPRFFLMVTVGYLVVNALFAALYVLDRNGVEGGTSYLDAFFFSVQTMATIGYGKMTPRSTFANVLVTVEALVGLLAMAMATGLLFAKFSRPTARVAFSNVIIINERDGVRTLALRMANERNSQILQANVQIVAIFDETTKEGEFIRRLRDLTLVRSQTPVFVMSWTVFHRITSESPLFEKSIDELRSANVSFVVAFMGLDDALSATVNSQKFYTMDDVVVDHRFDDMLRVDTDGTRVLDVSKIHHTTQETPASHS